MKLIYCLIGFLLFNTCSNNAEQDENCRFLLDVDVNVTINISLPQYSQLEFSGNSVYIANAGNAGIIVARVGNDYLAWDAGDPNQIPSTCSVLVPSELEAISNCDNKNKYSLVTGAPLENTSLRCSLKFYRVEQNGNVLTIFN